MSSGWTWPFLRSRASRIFALRSALGSWSAMGSSWGRCTVGTATLPNADPAGRGVTHPRLAEHVEPRGELAARPVDLPAAVAHHHVVRRVAELGAVARGLAQQPREVQQRAARRCRRAPATTRPTRLDRSMVSTTSRPDRAIASSITRGSALEGTTPITSKSSVGLLVPAAGRSPRPGTPRRGRRGAAPGRTRAKASSGCSTWTITSRHQTQVERGVVPRHVAWRCRARTRRARRCRARGRDARHGRGRGGAAPGRCRARGSRSASRAGTAWAPSPHPTSTTRLSGGRSSSRTTCSRTDGSRGARLSSRRAAKSASSRG